MKVEVRLNEADFFRFSVFNAFSRNQLWLRPAVFAAILSGCAGVCFALHDRDVVCVTESVVAQSCWAPCCSLWRWACLRPGF